MWQTVDSEVAAAVALLLSMRDDHPVLRRRELLAAGISDATMTAMIRRGVLHRLRHGVYAATAVVTDAEPAERHRIDVAAAIAAADHPVWAFGPSAALLHGLPLPFAAPRSVHLLREARQDTRSLRRTSKHRLVVPAVTVTSSAVDPADVLAATAGLPCLARDAAAVTASIGLSSRWKVALLDAALWNGGSSEQRLLELAARWRYLGDGSELRRALERARPGAQTVLETFSRLALIEEGLPEPELQTAFHDGGGLIGYVDMWWPGLRVIGEADGAIKYGAPADLMKEKAREDRLRALGHMVVRWTWKEIRESPGTVAARIRAAGRIAA